MICSHRLKELEARGRKGNREQAARFSKDQYYPYSHRPRKCPPIDFKDGAKASDDLDKAHANAFDSSCGFLDRLKLSIGW